MASLEDAEYLRSIWDPEYLGEFENCWIAFKNGRVLGSSSHLDDLSTKYEEEIQTNHGPLFAFVTFEATV